MNKDLFVHTDGLKYLLELQSFLLDTEWEKSSNDMKRMERVILQTIYHLASTFKLRRYIIITVIFSLFCVLLSLLYFYIMLVLLLFIACYFHCLCKENYLNTS